MKVRDLIRNNDFDVCAFIKIYACENGTTWNDGGRPVFSGYPEDLCGTESFLEKEVCYMTIDFESDGSKGLVIEYRDR